MLLTSIYNARTPIIPARPAKPKPRTAVGIEAPPLDDDDDADPVVEVFDAPPRVLPEEPEDCMAVPLPEGNPVLAAVMLPMGAVPTTAVVLSEDADAGVVTAGLM